MLDGADDDVAERVETFGKQPQCDALPGAGIAGDHHVTAVCDAELDAPQKGVDGRAAVEGFDGYVGAEGIELDAVERLHFRIHVVVSSSSLLSS